MTRDEIDLGFQLFLGRKPNSDSEVDQYLHISDPAQLRVALARKTLIPTLNAQYRNRVVIFVHLMKTAGHSLNAVFKPQFDAKKTFFVANRETMYSRSVAELAQYDYIYGHFDFSDSVAVPRSSKFIFSFFREPVSRLISYYRFANAHSLDNELMGDATFKAAKLMPPEQFFSSVEALESGTINNYYLNTFGSPPFSSWKCVRSGDKEIQERLQAALDAVKALSFIGLQERFDEDVESLVGQLGLEMPLFPVKINDSDSLWKSGMRYEPAPAVELTPRLREVISPLVKYDQIIFNAAKAEAESRRAAVA